MNTVLLLEMAADGMADRIAVGTVASGLTYAGLLDRARRSAAAAGGAERIALVGRNSELLPQMLFAAGIAGVPFVPVNFRLADDRLRAVLERTAPAFVVDDANLATRVGPLDGIELASPDDVRARARAATPMGGGGADADDVAVLLFTSGTTGEPKAAVLRHRHLVSYVMATVDFASAGDDEAALVSVPAYHVAGIAAILSAVFAGRRICYLPQFDPEGWVDLAATEAVTHAMVVPTMLGRILDVLERSGRTLPALRHLSYGGGRMPAPVIERAIGMLPGVGFVNAYGLTETSSTVAVLTPEEHRDAAASADPVVRARLGSVGRPLPAIELEIRDPEGRPVPAGVTGEIYVRGEQVAGEYLGRVVLAADGWFPTNDSGRLDDGGYLFVEGRLDDVIVRGGENLSPGEIEDVLLAHPAVAEAAVVGVPDDEWGEAVAAAVVLHEGTATTPDDLRGWVAERLRSSRAPAVVSIREELPYNETGKLLRRVLRAELAPLSPRS